MKKKLLSEAQVRRFMGLAGLNPLNETYNMEEDAVDMEEGVRKVDDLDEMGHARKADDGARKKVMEEEDPMEEPEGEADLTMDEDALARIKKNLDELQKDLAPLTDQVEGDMEEPEGAEGDLPDLEDDEEDPMAGADDMGGEEDEDEDMAALDEELFEVEMELTEDEIVNEVARRVAKRIVEAKRAHKKMNEALGRKR